MDNYLLKTAARATELYFYGYSLEDALKKTAKEFSRKDEGK